MYFGEKHTGAVRRRTILQWQAFCRTYARTGRLCAAACRGAMRGFGTLLWDAGVCSPAGQKKLLLTADLVVVNFEPQDYDGMEQFFLRHMYLEKRMVYLYANCIGTPEPDVLNRVYRVDEGQIGIVRYNAAYDCALKRGLGSSFIAEEYGSARSSRNQEFIDGLVKAADRILRRYVRSIKPDMFGKEKDTTEG